MSLFSCIATSLIRRADFSTASRTMSSASIASDVTEQDMHPEASSLVLATSPMKALDSITTGGSALVAETESESSCASVDTAHKHIAGPATAKQSVDDVSTKSTREAFVVSAAGAVVKRMDYNNGFGDFPFGRLIDRRNT